MHVDESAKAAEGCGLIVNVMTLDSGVNVLQAAIQVKSNYPDLSACENIADCPDPVITGWKASKSRPGGLLLQGEDVRRDVSNRPVCIPFHQALCP